MRTGAPSWRAGPLSTRTGSTETSSPFQFCTIPCGNFALSGWAWLTMDGTHQLAIETTPDQDSPWMVGKTPILGIDVWEHAYYLKYQNVRADYVAAFLKVISHDVATGRFQSYCKA